MNTSARRVALAAALLTLPLASCAKEAPKAADGSEKMDVVASFYPLEYLVSQVGGEHVNVTNLTKPGAEPHDVELSPQDVAKVGKAKLLVFESGIQSEVDAAAKNEAKDHSLDLAKSVDLSLKYDPAIEAGGADEHADEHAHESEGTHAAGETAGAHADEHAHESEGTHAAGTADAHEDEHAHEHEAEAGATDPHFWLDPVRYGKAAEAVAAKLKEIDPAHAAQYDENLKKFLERTGGLNTTFKTGLASCQNKNLVTSHAAFSYLADRYGLKQVAISGLSPEAEPAPGQLAKVAAFTKANKVTTIYAETLVDPKLSNTVAKETGARVEVLDPIEGLTDASKARDYFGIMEANLDTLKKGQQCS